MSKNVAVFVDVANIFYAAKAAGVDIDYVTLLKTATAGRDFVRAYAYTGLDPENENQRQFHQFLGRSGYKVVSKDIRKYGDGKVKANLDIELVVDLMKTARNLDIAVVVSGDGDFAPAIRAVQEMGVRVEVVSFRGNTSSDLIEVADLFTDITQIAKVEKGSARSGRRVAAEDDLSMTAVPDKESEGAPRRRRGGRGRTSEQAESQPTAARRPRRVTAPAALAEPAGAGLVVLPGEKLSRAATATSAAAADEEPAEALEGEHAEPVQGGRPEDEADGDGQGARRRRRRRGGRGRGRGRGAERALPTEEQIGELAGELAGEDEGLDNYVPAPPRVPQSTPFGSVWDSQLGVTTGPVLAGEELEEVYEDEPEIPEYLLAERRQRGVGRPGRPGQRGGRGRGGAYQAALERERFGRSGTGGTGGSPYGTPAGRGGGGRVTPPGRGPMGGRPARPDRPDRGPRPYVEPRPPAGSSSGDPWSEVPPEIEALLRAELARRPGERGSAPPQAPSPAAGGEEGSPATPPRRRAPAVGRAAAAPRRAASQPAPSEAASQLAPSEPEASEPAAATPKRGRPRTAKASAAAAPAPADGSDATAAAQTAGAAKRPRTTRAARSTAAVAGPAAEGEATATAAPTKRPRTIRSKAPASEG